MQAPYKTYHMSNISQPGYSWRVQTICPRSQLRTSQRQGPAKCLKITIKIDEDVGEYLPRHFMIRCYLVRRYILPTQASETPRRQLPNKQSIPLLISLRYPCGTSLPTYPSLSLGEPTEMARFICSISVPFVVIHATLPVVLTDVLAPTPSLAPLPTRIGPRCSAHSLIKRHPLASPECLTT